MVGPAGGSEGVDEDDDDSTIQYYRRPTVDPEDDLVSAGVFTCFDLACGCSLLHAGLLHDFGRGRGRGGRAKRAVQASGNLPRELAWLLFSIPAIALIPSWNTCLQKNNRQPGAV